MAELNQIYRCNICGNIVSVLHAGPGELVCCGQPMEMLKENTAKSEGKEKHVPVVKISGDKVIVTVGSVEHPMQDAHYITMIEVLKNGIAAGQKRLKPGEKPVAEFMIADSEGIKARALCNIHGLWTD